VHPTAARVVVPKHRPHVGSPWPPVYPPRPPRHCIRCCIRCPRRPR